MKKFPNITFFSVLPPFRGGIAQFSEELRKSLLKKTEVTAFTFQKQYPDFLFPGQTQFEETATEFKDKRVVSTFRPWTYLRALRMFKKSNGTVFLTNYWMSFFGPMMGFWGRFLPKNTVKIAVIHNLIPHEKRFFDHAFNRYFLRAYDGFVVLSEAVKTDVLSVYPEAKTILLKHPSYLQYGKRMNRMEACEKLGLDSAKQTVLFFGLIRDYKGLDILLKAFSELDASFQLVIAGEVYGDRKLYTELIAASKNTQIYFHDRFIPSEEVAVYFSAADLCVLPYKSATQSGIKALCDAFQVPVLVSRVGGLSEEIIAGETGFVIAEMSALSIAQQIKQITTSDSLSKVQKNLQLQAPSIENEWDEFAQSVLDFSNQLAQSKN
ncbi:MAG: glycosyltransferase [Crocinitomicaceae bacterium]